jgi:hypothetical protein
MELGLLFPEIANTQRYGGRVFLVLAQLHPKSKHTTSFALRSCFSAGLAVSQLRDGLEIKSLAFYEVAHSFRRS